MRYLRCFFAFLTAAVCAVLLYCLYLKAPDPLTRALAPRNGSPWELGKLAFWSMLPAALTLHHLEPGSSRSGLCAAVLLSAVLAAALTPLGLPPAILYLLSFAAALTAYVLLLRRLQGGELLWYAVLLLLAIACILFSILPPAGGLFTDPADVSAIAPIPF